MFRRARHRPIASNSLMVGIQSIFRSPAVVVRHAVDRSTSNRDRNVLRRADRLFGIIQLLRRMKLTRARDLMASGVPVEGEAGVR